jgi:hypothetical protein
MDYLNLIHPSELYVSLAPPIDSYYYSCLTIDIMLTLYYAGDFPLGFYNLVMLFRFSYPYVPFRN